MSVPGFAAGHSWQKRKRHDIDDDGIGPKRQRRATPRRTGPDLLSPLSDELLLRILSFLPLRHLLAVLPVSRRFYHLASDSQLWKALYYTRFVLPRARRIAGFRDNTNSEPPRATFARKRALNWAVRDDAINWVPSEDVDQLAMREETSKRREAVNWKKQYRLRYNWVMGRCIVEELGLGVAGEEPETLGQPRRTLAKVVGGFTITADSGFGLRLWDLRDRKLLLHRDLTDKLGRTAVPSCIGLDDSGFASGIVDVAIGFTDGSFGVWRLFIQETRSTERYRHQKRNNNALISISYSHPYLMTATSSVVASVYTFDVSRPSDHHVESKVDLDLKCSLKPSIVDINQQLLPTPYLLTSLNSQISRPPLTCSIRQTASVTIASIVYTTFALQGWSIGIQDLHITPGATPSSTPDVGRTRVAMAPPFITGGIFRHPVPSYSDITVGPAFPRCVPPIPSPSNSLSLTRPVDCRPKTLCYSHPYLLATFHDDTLRLYTCTSDASTLDISPGVTLFGHTSGVSVAEITNRGKAVSVSARGEELRVWELEGRVGGAIRTTSVPIPSSDYLLQSSNEADGSFQNEKRNWVGFDDEMVIVLREKKDGRDESLLVYDFT